MKKHLQVSPQFLEWLKHEALEISKQQGNWARCPLWKAADRVMRELIQRRQASPMSITISP